MRPSVGLLGYVSAHGIAESVALNVLRIKKHGKFIINCTYSRKFIINTDYS